MGSGIPGRVLLILLSKKWLLETQSHRVFGAPGSTRRIIQLVSILEDGVSNAGFSVERRPYAPHITLMRNALCRNLPELSAPIAWQAREWLLVKSEQTSGHLYAPVGRWSLKKYQR